MIDKVYVLTFIKKELYQFHTSNKTILRSYADLLTNLTIIDTNNNKIDYYYLLHLSRCLLVSSCSFNMR